MALTTDTLTVETTLVAPTSSQTTTDIATAVGVKADKTTTISAGTGLNGGGDLSTNRTLNHNINNASPGTFGSASQSAVVVVDSQGHATSVTQTAISLTASAITNFAATVLATVLTGFVASTNTIVSATDTILQALQKLQAQVSARESSITGTTSADFWSGAKTFINFASTVLSTVLTGFVASTNTAIAATDTVLQGLQKLQAQVTAREPSITSGTTAQFWRGDKTFQDLFTQVRAATLTGIVFTSQAAITATDTVLSALGKIQTQIDAWTELVTTADVTNTSSTTPTNVTELSIPVTAGKTYRYELTAIYESTATTTGFAISVVTPDTAAGNIAMTARMIIAADGTSAEYAGAITSLGDLVIGTDVPAINTRYVCTVIGTFVCTASGNIQPEIRRESGAGTTVTLRAGSCLLSREF